MRVSDANSDEALLSRYYQDADELALTLFIQRHRDWACRKARRFVSHDEAEDIVQSSIVRMMSACPANGVVNNPLGWWHTIIAATANDYIRESARRRLRERTYAETRTEPSDLQETVADQQFVRMIFNEFDKNKNGFRDTLQKRYIEELSYQEIARELDIKTGTVASRLARGINHVRAALAQRGFEVPPSQPKAKTMAPDSNAQASEQFQSRWHDSWVVFTTDRARGVGHIEVETGDSDERVLRHSLDIVADDRLTADPRTTKNRVSHNDELVLTDVASFDWRSFRSQEDAFGSAKRMMAERNMLYEGDDTFSPSQDGNGLEMRRGTTIKTIEAAGEGPLVPDILVSTYICQLPLDQDAEYPIRLLSFERSTTGRNWGVLPIKARYAGRSGPPFGLSHTFEIETQQVTGRKIYIWLDEDGSFVGSGDEQMSMLAVDDFDTACNMLASNTQ